MKLSRSAIEQFIRCPKCFFLERKLGLKGPSMVPLTLAVATDALLKNEFDAYRGSELVHPLWEKHGLNVSAFLHPDLELWRSNFKGIRVPFGDGVEIFGAVDDVWQDRQTRELYIVDFKSTSKRDAPTLEGGFGDGYKRQMEMYQWLLRRAGFAVSATGFFLYVNGIKNRRFYQDSLTGVMQFDTTLIPYVGNDVWVEDVIRSAVAILQQQRVPKQGSACDSCRYFNDRANIESASI